MNRLNKKIAVVLFNLGGPDEQNDVRPFLKNLFSDPAIIDLPFGFRHLLAEIISRRRERTACANYQLMGGGSCLLEETENQRASLEQELKSRYPDYEWFCVTAMRYWEPRAKSALEKVIEFAPDEVVLLPLYPQFSKSTSQSSFDEWEKLAQPYNWKTRKIVSYETDDLFIKAHVDRIIKTWEKSEKPNNIKVLFSAHGLPQRNIERGDPYQQQIESTVTAIVSQLPKELQETQICYQSRVGRLKWIGPSTIETIEKAGEEKQSVMLVPVSFVSEHVETLVELDIEIFEIAKRSGVNLFLRVEALRTHPDFILALAELVFHSMTEIN